MSGVSRDTSGDAMREALAAPARPEVKPTEETLQALWKRMPFLREALLESARLHRLQADYLKAPPRERKDAHNQVRMCIAHASELEAIEKRALRASQTNGAAADR